MYLNIKAHNIKYRDIHGKEIDVPQKSYKSFDVLRKLKSLTIPV